MDLHMRLEGRTTALTKNEKKESTSLLIEPHKQSESQQREMGLKLMDFQCTLLLE